MTCGKSKIDSVFKSFIAWLVGLLKKKSSPPLIILHPEEPPDYSKTMDNTTTEGLLEAWFKGWRVPQQYQAWWLNGMNI